MDGSHFDTVNKWTTLYQKTVCVLNVIPEVIRSLLAIKWCITYASVMLQENDTDQNQESSAMAKLQVES